MSRVLILLAHPQIENSRVARALVAAAHSVAHSVAHAASADASPAPPQIVLRDLYALYPDYLIDVEAEQAALAGVTLLVWLHPIHWYSMPPLMKLWLDEVLTLGWAYGPGGQALQGVDLWLAASTGGPEASYRPTGYNRYFFDAFLPPYEQTAALTGMRFLPPWLLHGAHQAETPAWPPMLRCLGSACAATPTGPSWPTCPRARNARCRASRALLTDGRRHPPRQAGQQADARSFEPSPEP